MLVINFLKGREIGSFWKSRVFANFKRLARESLR